MTDAPVTIEGLACPVPLTHGEQIVMGHGSGGKMTHDLIRKAFLPCFDNPALRAGDDAGVVRIDEKTRLAISTDMHTVQPLFFPGGDIGKLAVCGTVNDVAMVGARPLYLSAGFILEEQLLCWHRSLPPSGKNGNHRAHAHAGPYFWMIPRTSSSRRIR